MVAQRTVREAFDHNSEHGANEHRANQHGKSAAQRLARKISRDVKPGERANHENITVREIDETEDAVNHGVTEGDERVNCAERETVEQLLEKFVQGLIVSTYLNLPSLIVMMTAALVALRCSSR